MTAEHEPPEPSPKQRVDMKIGSVLGNTYGKVPRRRVWMNRGDSPIITALDVSEKSPHQPKVSLVSLRAFVGTEPPENLPAWHIGFQLRLVPHILAVSGKHIEGLPQHLEEGRNINTIERDAEKIAQAAGIVLGYMRTPEGISALIERLEALQPKLSRILGITVVGQQALGIRIS